MTTVGHKQINEVEMKIMYTRILIPLDGSKTAEKVLPYAHYLAGRFKIPVELFAVVDIAEMGGVVRLELHDLKVPFVLIAGPCQIESREHAIEVAEVLAGVTTVLTAKKTWSRNWSPTPAKSAELPGQDRAPQTRFVLLDTFRLNF